LDFRCLLKREGSTAYEGRGKERAPLCEREGARQRQLFDDESQVAVSLQLSISIASFASMRPLFFALG